MSTKAELERELRAVSLTCCKLRRELATHNVLNPLEGGGSVRNHLIASLHVAETKRAELEADNLAADYAWSLVEQGELRAFSVASVKGSSTVAGSVLGTKFYSTWTLSEISLVRTPANPDCNNVEIFSRRRRIP
jgi:hypothetical protein